MAAAAPPPRKSDASDDWAAGAVGPQQNGTQSAFSSTTQLPPEAEARAGTSHRAPDAGVRFGWEGMRDVPPFLEHDPFTAGWQRRRDDPNVQARMRHLQEKSGIKGLEVCEPHEVERIVRIFLRDGFCAVSRIMDDERLAALQQACAELIAERVAETPHGVTYGVHPESGERFTIRQPGRYSFGSHGNLHRREWCMLADLPLLRPILEAIFQSPDYMCWGAGGDFCLPGTIEYQHLHRDCGEADFQDPSGGNVKLWDLPPPMVTCNFPTVDCNALNGPIRQIPGTQNTHVQPPQTGAEPEWMKLSTVFPLKAGDVIIRDLRAWVRFLVPVESDATSNSYSQPHSTVPAGHALLSSKLLPLAAALLLQRQHGGTPNLSEEIRAIPNCEFHAPWYWHAERMQKTMPHENWLELSEHGRHVCRYIKCDEADERLSQHRL